MAVIFILLVLLGFAFHFLSTWSVNYATRIAWGCWLVASVIWAIQQSGLHV